MSPFGFTNSPTPLRLLPKLSTLRVLIVEDQEDAAATYRLLLCLHGVGAKSVPDGPSALALMPSFEPDAVLLDIGLPGMDGWELARRIKAGPTRKPPFLIAVTGSGRPEDLRKSADAGIDLHLVKPVHAERLVGLLKRFGRVVG
jgi:CheY-like chemotaxis protein